MKQMMIAAVAAVTLSTTGAVEAATVTPDVIFGSGNANGGFTIVTEGSVELGLRAKLRYDLNGQPQNTFPWDNVDTYNFQPSDGNAPSNRAIWNYEWSVNTNVDGDGGALNLYTYQIGITGPDGYAYSYNPFAPFRDVSLGTNATGNGGGTGRNFGQSLSGSIPGNRNVAQASENIGFFYFNNPAPQAEGQYAITLSVFSGGSLFASNTIFVNYGDATPMPIPLPAGGALLLSGLLGFGLLRRRQKRA